MSLSKPPNILIVDDDRRLLRLLEHSLNGGRFSTVTVASGSEAIRWLGQNRPDLMLLDLKLQDIEGKELINHLAGTGRFVPFIIMTGQGDEDAATEMMKRGALDYLVKDGQFIQLAPMVVERALKKLTADSELTATQAALEESRTQVLLVSEREQRRFGAELHDGLGQQLTAIELRCQSLKHDIPKDQVELQDQILQICQLLRDTITQARSMAHGLAPLELGSRGLTNALSELATRMSKTGKIKCTFQSSSRVLVHDIFMAGHLFRIAQEAVNNAVKHSKASEVTIRLRRKKNAVQLEVRDNGRGWSAPPGKNGGIGLQLMNHRASAIGAELEIHSKKGSGVMITCTVPIESQ
jgi:signal transduction histidine kinase